MHGFRERLVNHQVAGIFHVEPAQCHAMSVFLQLEGFSTFFATERLAFRDMLADRFPDVVILGDHQDALELLSVMAGVRSIIPVIVLTEDAAAQRKALALGAHAFPGSQGGMDEATGKYFATLLRKLTDRPYRRPTKQVEPEWTIGEVLSALSPRQSEVLKHIIDGLPDHAIAAATGLGKRCVELDRRTIYARLGVSDESELVQVLAKKSLRDPPEASSPS